MPIILPSLRYPAALFSRRIFRDFDRLRASSKGKGAKPQIPNRVRTAPASGSRASTPSRPLVRRRLKTSGYSSRRVRFCQT